MCYCYSQIMAEGLLLDDFKIFIVVLGVGIVKNRLEEKKMILKTQQEETKDKVEKLDLERQIVELSKMDDISMVK